MKNIFCAFTLIFLTLLFSCKKQTPSVPDGQAYNFEISDEEKSGGKATSKLSWHPTQKKVCIVFGYGYNDKDYVQGIVQTLSEKYGLDDGSTEGGLIFPLVFPDDFPANRITRISGILEDRELAGLIIVGAPENTNYAIANLEDEYSSQEKMIPYPVYAFFPQDDVSGIEATANFVVDRALEGSGSSDDESNKEEVVQTQVKDLARILDSAVEYMLLTEKPLPADQDLIVHVARILGKPYKVSRYVDPDSGLQSINHFVIEDAQK